MEVGYRRKDGFPIGFRFKPKDVELVEHYLLPRLQGRRTVPNDSVVEANVYACHPETLANEYRSGGQDEWYFLSPRARMYGNGVRPARKTLDGRGRWKASTATKEVAQEVVCNGTRFCKNVLNYFEGVPKKEVRTKWIMLELTVPEYEIKLDKPGPKLMLDEYVMCKIYVSPIHKKKGDADDDEEEDAGSACEEEEVACSSTQHSQVTAESSKLSESSDKQAGKRPMSEQPLLLGGARPAPKQARHGSLSIGPTQASCTTGSNASRTEVYHGVPGRPMGGGGVQAPPRMQQQRPAGAYYNGQAPPSPTPTPPVVQYQPFSQQYPFDEPYGLMPPPMPVQQYQPFSSPIDEPFGLMTRPTNQGNQAATTARQPCFPGNPQPTRLPVSAQCFYEQNYRAVQPLGNASSSQQQQPIFNGDASRSGGAAAVSRGQSHSSYHPYQPSSSSTPAASGHGGPAKEKNVIVNAEEYFAQLANFNPSLVVGRMQPEPAPPAAGAGRGKTGTGEASGLNAPDAA